MRLRLMLSSGLVLFEQVSRLCKRNDIPIHIELVVARIFRDRDDLLHGVAALTKDLYEKIDVNHGLTSCEGSSRCYFFAKERNRMTMFQDRKSTRLNSSHL